MTNQEISHYEKFLYLPQCFQKSSDASESVCLWERVKHIADRVSSDEVVLLTHYIEQDLKKPLIDRLID